MKASLPFNLASCFVLLCVCALSGCHTAEPWTIQCFEFQGVEHRETVQSIAEALGSAGGINKGEITVRHESDKSTIYYGTYRRNIDRMKGRRDIPARLSRDLGLIRELVDDHGRRLFVAARMVRQPQPDIGPAEWDLNYADGVYSLQVAVFEPTPGRWNYKKSAVDMVRNLRLRRYEAYYHHNDERSVSEVTVGTFGEDAVIKRDGRAAYSAEVRDLQRKENFRYNLTNGAIWHAIIDGQKAPVRSLLVRIPKADGEDH